MLRLKVLALALVCGSLCHATTNEEQKKPGIQDKSKETEDLNLGRFVDSSGRPASVVWDSKTKTFSAQGPAIPMSIKDEDPLADILGHRW